MTTLLLYTTSGCHLCEQAAALMQPELNRRGISLSEVEITEEDTLLERYGVRIPVIHWPGLDTDLGWPFSEDEFLDYLDKRPD